MRFVAKVRKQEGRQAWFIEVPELGVNTWVHDETKIHQAAHQIISRCGVTPRHFDIQIVHGRMIPAVPGGLEAAA